MEEDEALLPMYEWIEENYGINEDDDPSDWSDAVDEYEGYIHNIQEREAYYHAAEEYDFYIHQAVGGADVRFNEKLIEFKDYLTTERPRNPAIFYKMCIAHVVTIFETYMEDLAKSLIINGGFLRPFVLASNLLTSKQYSLKEIMIKKDEIQEKTTDKMLSELALKHLSKDVLYHDLTKVANIFEYAMGRALKLSAVEKPLNRFMYLRHDVIHRDGANHKGTEARIDIQVVDEAITAMENYTSQLRSEIGHLGD